MCSRRTPLPILSTLTETTLRGLTVRLVGRPSSSLSGAALPPPVLYPCPYLDADASFAVQQLHHIRQSNGTPSSKPQKLQPQPIDPLHLSNPHPRTTDLQQREAPHPPTSTSTSAAAPSPSKLKQPLRLAALNRIIPRQGEHVADPSAYQPCQSRHHGL